METEPHTNFSKALLSVWNFFENDDEVKPEHPYHIQFYKLKLFIIYRPDTGTTPEESQ